MGLNPAGQEMSRDVIRTAAMSRHNRDVIRTAAKSVGVVNVSYKSKAENIAAMVEMGVVAVDVDDDGVVSVTKGVAPEADVEDVGDEAADSADEIEGAEDALVESPSSAGAEEGSIPSPDDSAPSPSAEEEATLATLGGLASVLDQVVQPLDDEEDWEDEPEEVETCFHGRPVGLCANPECKPADDVAIVDENPQPFPYTIVSHLDGRSTVSFVSGAGDLVSCTSDQDAYVRVVTSLLAGEDPTQWLDAELALANAIAEAQIGDHVEVVKLPDGSKRVTYDGVVVHGRIVDQVLRYHREGRDSANVVKFMENAARNPVEGAVEGLFRWADADRLAIDAEGYFIGYKAVLPVRADEEGNPVEGLYESNGVGHGFVNGVEFGHEGHVRLPQRIGDVVTMSRDEVLPGPECGVGLHVGSFDYASGFLRHAGGVVMEVRVDPADVVNIPFHDTGKMRVVRYQVVGFHDGSGDLSHHEAPPTWVEDSPEVEAAIEESVPKGFWAKIKARRSAKKGRG